MYGKLDQVTGKLVSFNTLDQTATIEIIYAQPGEAPTITNVLSVKQTGIRSASGEILSIDITPEDLETRISDQVITVMTSDTRKIVGLQIIDKATGVVVVDEPRGITITPKGPATEIYVNKLLEDGTYSIKVYYEDGKQTVLSNISTNNSNGQGATFTINSTQTITEFREARKTIGDLVYGSLSLVSNNGGDLRTLNLAKSSSPFLTIDGDILTTQIDGELTAIEIPEQWQDTDGDPIKFGVSASKTNNDLEPEINVATQSTTVAKSNGAKLTINWARGTFVYDVSNRDSKGDTVDLFTVTATDPKNSLGTLSLLFDVLDILPQDRLPTGVFNSEKQAELDQLLIKQIKDNPDISSADKEKLINQLENSASSGNPAAKVSKFEDAGSPLSVFRVRSDETSSGAKASGLTISNVSASSNKNNIESATDPNAIQKSQQQISAILADLDDDQLSALKATLKERFGITIDDGIKELVDGLYGGDPAASIGVKQGESDIGLPIFAFDLNTNIGSTFADSDPNRPGTQVNITLDLTSANLAASALNSFQKVVSAVEFIKYAVWLSSLDPEVRRDNLFVDTSGVLITGPGRYNFLRTTEGGDGAAYEYYNRLVNGQNVQYIKSVNLIITDNRFGDFALTPGKDYLTGDGQIKDPGAPIYSIPTSTGGGGTGSGSSGSSSSSSTTSLGIFEVANSDQESPATAKTDESSAQGTDTLAAVTSDVQTRTVTNDSSGDGQNKQLVKGLKRSSQDNLRSWAKRLGLLQASGGLGLLENDGNNQKSESSPLDFLNKRLGIDPERSSDLLNALLFGGASIYIINKTSPGRFKQWAEALWSNQTKQASAMSRSNRVIAIFLIRSNEGLDRLVAAEVQDDAIEILAEEKLLFSLDTAAKRHQASFDTKLKKLCLKLENIGLTTHELLLLDPEIKSELAIVEHLGRDIKIMEPDRLRSVVQELSSTELNQLQAWLAKPSSNPLDGHPIQANLQRRQSELGKQLSPEKANVASLIELSLAIGLHQPALSLV